jgi:hypothetical protein
LDAMRRLPPPPPPQPEYQPEYQSSTTPSPPRPDDAVNRPVSADNHDHQRYQHHQQYQQQGDSSHVSVNENGAEPGDHAGGDEFDSSNSSSSSDTAQQPQQQARATRSSGRVAFATAAVAPKPKPPPPQQPQAGARRAPGRPSSSSSSSSRSGRHQHAEMDAALVPSHLSVIELHDTEGVTISVFGDDDESVDGNQRSRKQSRTSASPPRGTATSTYPVRHSDHCLLRHVPDARAIIAQSSANMQIMICVQLARPTFFGSSTSNALLASRKM